MTKERKGVEYRYMKDETLLDWLLGIYLSASIIGMSLASLGVLLFGIPNPLTYIGFGLVGIGLVAVIVLVVTIAVGCVFGKQ